jgi:hypothetical protein
MKFPKKISDIFRNLRPGPFGLFPKYPTDILGGAGKFVKIYENFPMGNFQRPGVK